MFRSVHHEAMLRKRIKKDANDNGQELDDTTNTS